MALQDALDDATAVLRTRPSDLLPVYFLTPALPVITRVVTFLGLLLAYVRLETTGRLAQFRDGLAARDLDPPSPDAQPEAFEEWVDGLIPVLEPLVDPVAIGALLLAAGVSLLLFVALYGAVTAAQVAACYGRLQSERGLTAAVSGVGRYWLTYVGLWLFEFLLWVLLTVGLVAVIAAAAGAGGAGVGILIGLLGFLVWVVVGIAIRAVFAIAPAAVVVDDTGVVGSLRGSVRFVRANTVDAFGYYALAIGVLFGLAVLSGVLGVVGGTPIVALAGFAFVAPLLDLVKTSLYGEYGGTVDPPTAPDVRLRDQATAGLRRGWSELWSFVRSTPLLHALGLAVMVGGFAAGWFVSGPYEGVITTSVEDRLDVLLGPGAPLEIAGNNVTVAISTAYAGVALAVPTLVSLLYNGLALGLYARLEVAPAELLAFVVPHGIIEIPALVVSGALGLYVGVAAWRTVRGRASRAALADSLERGFWVLVGIAVLLLIAGVIEGFVSPYYYRLFM